MSYNKGFKNSQVLTSKVAKNYDNLIFTVFYWHEKKQIICLPHLKIHEGRSFHFNSENTCDFFI